MVKPVVKSCNTACYDFKKVISKVCYNNKSQNGTCGFDYCPSFGINHPFQASID